MWQKKIDEIKNFFSQNISKQKEANQKSENQK